MATWHQFDDGTWYNNRAQFYVNCAQIDVVGEGGGVIEHKDMIKIPGAAYAPNATGESAFIALFVAGDNAKACVDV